ncbi:histidine phosphatase family protein [Tropicibacter naphthalenivorans]|uniref:Bifunctional RNase H/acid phosphatase n=1 Tax=Tropicibacter naphthalenivorans TaxID=441103 RepID=A0A0P1GGS5_9RHOB|nr:histidine phosphatase family protein [Tropicibacter naphthalenivorans]CUH80847.1 bifunctional RNase H/acid phosphatase [Tropicibacter naphthalenivorans]SMC90579.1 alpha-ribazole phosphatase [Tropicibacter naphthalenivorans]
MGAELLLIRHAPVAEPGRLMGRTDVAARVDPLVADRVRAWVGGVSLRRCSPALRCRQTFAALWPDAAPKLDTRLWEQDFGDHDGLPFGDLPDLGVLSSAELSAYAAPNGESFDDLCARVWPALQDCASLALQQNAPVAVVAHAGVVRAGLAMVLGAAPLGLAFEIAPLSVTRLRVGPDGPVSVIEVNRT